MDFPLRQCSLTFSIWSKGRRSVRSRKTTHMKRAEIHHPATHTRRVLHKFRKRGRRQRDRKKGNNGQHQSCKTNIHFKQDLHRSQCSSVHTKSTGQGRPWEASAGATVARPPSGTSCLAVQFHWRHAQICTTQFGARGESTARGEQEDQVTSSKGALVDPDTSLAVWKRTNRSCHQKAMTIAFLVAVVDQCG